MIEGPIPPDEPQRLAALRKLNVLDSGIEARFERITQMVRRLLNVPIASISLVDQTRQWSKSYPGLPSAETPRNIAFCPHTILGDEVMVVHNATNDPRFADNPLVVGDPHIIFYAGQPLRSPDGYKVGALCAIDHQPRTLTPEQLQTLKELAAMVEVELAALTPSKIREGLLAELGFSLKEPGISSAGAEPSGNL